MITVEFRDQLGAEESAELATMLAEAASYDEEAGFSSAVPAGSAQGTDGGDGAGGNVVVRQALARLTPGMHASPDTPLVAFLRLDIDRAGGAVAQMVVRRSYRSLGIATLMMELLSDLPGDGWAGTGAVSINCWAHGSHPAAERMARRLGADITSSRWKLMRGAEVRYVDAEDEPAVLTARQDGFVHEHTDVCYTWRVRVKPEPATPTAP